jgi:hypothetical protein
VACADQDRELILQLLDDVQLLERKVAYDLPSPTDLRATFSPVLRRWIIDGAFFLVQKLLTERVLFEMYSRTDDVKWCQAGIYTWWMGTIYSGNGIAIGTNRLAQKYADNRDLIPERRKPFLISQKAKMFFGQPCFLWKEKLYTREDAIKFLANKLGGTHYAMDRHKKEIHVQEIQSQFGVIYDSPGNARILAPGELLALRADPNTRDRVFDAIQLTVGDTASIFCKGIRSYEGQIRYLLESS